MVRAVDLAKPYGISWKDSYSKSSPQHARLRSWPFELQTPCLQTENQALAMSRKASVFKPAGDWLKKSVVYIIHRRTQFLIIFFAPETTSSVLRNTAHHEKKNQTSRPKQKQKKWYTTINSPSHFPFRRFRRSVLDSISPILIVKLVFGIRISGSLGLGLYTSSNDW